MHWPSYADDVRDEDRFFRQCGERLAPSSGRPVAPFARSRAVAGAEDAQNAIGRIPAGLNGDSVRMVVKHHTPQVRACHERATKQTPDPAGVVEIRFTISTLGKVASSSAHRNTFGARRPGTLSRGVEQALALSMAGERGCGLRLLSVRLFRRAVTGAVATRKGSR